MKKLAVAILVAAVFALSQCSLFSKTVEYNVSGELVEVNTSAPWSTSFNLFSSERPFLA